MFGKKATTETMSFLIGIVIFIMLVVPIIMATVHACQAKSAMEKTLEMLVERTEKLKDNENGSIIGHVEKNYVLLGFSKNKNMGEEATGWTCGTGLMSTKLFIWSINKPKQCGDRACLCMCEFGLAGGILPPDACDKGICKLYSEGFDPVFYGGSECEYGPFIDPSEPVVEITFQKEGQNVGICRFPPCLSKEIHEARQSFETFVSDYDACKKMEGEDCICSEKQLKFPHGFRIMASSDGEHTLFALRDPDSVIRGRRYFDKDTLMYYNTQKNGIAPVSDIEFGRGLDSTIECAGEACVVIKIPIYNLNVSLYKTSYGASFVKNSEWPALKAQAKMCNETAKAPAETTAEQPPEEMLTEPLPPGWKSS